MVESTAWMNIDVLRNLDRQLIYSYKSKLMAASGSSSCPAIAFAEPIARNPPTLDFMDFICLEAVAGRRYLGATTSFNIDRSSL